MPAAVGPTIASASPGSSSKLTPCAIQIGAYQRVLTDLEQRAVDVLCGGDVERPITANDARVIRESIELLREGEARRSSP